jgi:hypothetical protein
LLLKIWERHPERGSFIAEPRDLGGPIGAGAPKGRIQSYRFDVPRTSFFTLRFIEPRAAVRLPLGAAFFRDALRDFLRSSLV